ncbi:MAG: NAD(P)-dependent oxidoreductase [Candidatus Omnitrophica bacterium]|nr:NAD(P)-dependent oxidoreductase [Candidatus Omnitrophota bacterium]MCB9720780.1 NAD(P)-dependent oxidoreductase [Candidatus Omnitrophota bacterium]
MGQPQGDVQSQRKRSKNFNEVSLGYPKKLAAEESRRCPQCSDAVCVAACPLGIDIPGFVRRLREGRVQEAYEIIRRDNVLPGICGRICSAPCEKSCILNEEGAPIGIRLLERYAADHGRPRTRRDPAVRKGKKIAVIGSGPAGLSAAAELAQRGYQVTVYESFDQPGGVLRYGIPEFRVPTRVLDGEIEEIRALGVSFETNCYVGWTKSLEEIKKEGHVAVVLALGAGVPKFMDLPGTHLGGVYYGEEFLLRINQLRPRTPNLDGISFPLGQKIVVIGSGNTALDCARTARRLGKDVTLVFRRSIDDMRVREEERKYAEQEGVVIEPLIKPLEILPSQDNYVDGLKCMRIDYADVTSDGRWSLIPVPDSEFVMEADAVVIAIGHEPNTALKRISKRLKFNEDGTLKVDADTGMTSLKGVYAAGNVVTNAGPVVEAIASGRIVAQQIHKTLMG